MSKYTLLLAAALLLITSPFNCAAEEKTDLPEAEKRMAEIEQNLDQYRARFNELKNIGYGGATLRSDLDTLGLAVGDLVKELEELKEELTSGSIVPVMVWANKKYKNTVKETSFQYGQRFYLHHVLAYLPEDTATTWDLFLYDQDTGALVKEVKNLGMKKEVLDTRAGKISMFTNTVTWTQVRNLKIQSVVTPENGDPIIMQPAFVSIKDNSEPLEIHLPDEMVEDESYAVSYNLPEGFKPPFTMTLKYKGIEGRFEENGSMECQTSEMVIIGEDGRAVHPRFKEPPEIMMPTFYRNQCRVYENLGRLPDTAGSIESGKVDLTMIVEDAGGRKATGRKTLSFVPFNPRIKTLAMIAPEKSDDFLLREMIITEARAGDTVAAYVAFKVSTADEKNYHLRAEAVDLNTGNRLGSHDILLTQRRREEGEANLVYKKYNWNGANNIRIRAWIEDAAGNNMCEETVPFTVTNERMTIVGPSNIMAIKKIPFSLRVPSDFEPPIQWIANHNDDMLGVWPANSSKNSMDLTGTEGVMFGFARGKPGRGQIRIKVSDRNGRVALGSKNINISLNPDAEKGIFDDIVDMIDGIGDAMVIAGETMADPDGPLAQYVENQGNPGGTGPGNWFKDIEMLEDEDDLDEDPWPTIPSGPPAGPGPSVPKEDKKQPAPKTYYVVRTRNDYFGDREASEYKVQIVQGKPRTGFSSPAPKSSSCSGGRQSYRYFTWARGPMTKEEAEAEARQDRRVPMKFSFSLGQNWCAPKDHQARDYIE